MTRCILALSLLAAACSGPLVIEGAPPRSDGGPGDSGPRLRLPSDDAGADDGGVSPIPTVDAGPPPSAEPDGGPPQDLTPEEADLLRAINDERRSLGLREVVVDPRLMCAARRHAMDVGASGACGHVGSDGSWPWDRAEACGFPQESWTVNEIAAGPGFRDGDDAVSGWRQSSGHYAALTHERAESVGVGVFDSCFIALFDCCVAGSGG